ncbi:NYN domain-containing protein [Acidovorax sp. FG27]|uniref:NYN domain-containing protein n=1 Tax=Acidovorax sp. FG27 TaxID=3133652 RepID=UPI0030E9A2C4
MIAFFIDADNLCSCAWVEEACLLLDAEGTVSLRRAYGSAEKLKGLADVLRTRLIRPYVNLSLSKNTTDVALAIDAMEVSCAAPCPAVFAIGSGDADFVPLVLRLRERGFRVICVSQKGKMAPEAVYAYDKVFFVGEGDGLALPNAPAFAARDEQLVPVAKTVTAPVAAAETAPTKKPAAKKTAGAVKPGAAAKVAKKTPAKKDTPTAKKATVAKSQPGTPKSVSMEDVLKHAPVLRSGEVQPLGEIVKLLHDAKLLGKNAASTKLFKKYPQHFELSPARQPNKVRYILTAH